MSIEGSHGIKVTRTMLRSVQIYNMTNDQRWRPVSYKSRCWYFLPGRGCSLASDWVHGHLRGGPRHRPWFGRCQRWFVIIIIHVRFVQKGSKRGSKRDPKGIQKGSKGDPKGAQRGAKGEEKGNKKGIKRDKERVVEWWQTVRVAWRRPHQVARTGAVTVWQMATL